MSNSGGDFTLKSNEAFAERRKNIFDQLKTIESNLNDSSTLKQSEQMETNEILNDSNKRKPLIKSQTTRHYRGKESIFKSPDDKITKEFIRRMPDFKKNPHKWTRYTLSDVKDDDISDKGNTRAAMSFLNEIKTRKTIEDGDVDGSSKKIIFKKRIIDEKIRPNKSNNDDDNDDKVDNKGSFRNSKVVMPEYVVGQKMEKTKRNRDVKNSNNNSNNSCKQLKLNHLYEEAEDE